VSDDLAASLEVLLIRCKALICAGEPLAAYELADALTKENPLVAEAWVLFGRVTALVPSKGSAEAIELMESVVPIFPKEPAIPFTLACLTCQMGRLVDSHSWWMRALAVAKNQGTEREWKRRALIEPDLQLLWTAKSLG
jgi:hypothetical protein